MAVAHVEEDEQHAEQDIPPAMPNTPEMKERQR